MKSNYFQHFIKPLVTLLFRDLAIFINKSKASHNSEIRSDEAVYESINNFSNDFVEVLKSIIMQTKSWYAKERLWCDIKTNGTYLNSNKVQDESVCNLEASPLKTIENQKYFRVAASPVSAFDGPVNTPAQKESSLKQWVRKSLFSNVKASRNNSPFKSTESETSSHFKTCDWVQKSVDRNKMKHHRACKNLINHSKSRQRNSQLDLYSTLNAQSVKLTQDQSSLSLNSKYLIPTTPHEKKIMSPRSWIKMRNTQMNRTIKLSKINLFQACQPLNDSWS